MKSRCTISIITNEKDWLIYKCALAYLMLCGLPCNRKHIFDKNSNQYIIIKP